MGQVKGNKSARQSFATGAASTSMVKLNENCKTIEFDVRCSYLEIYNE